MKTFISSSEFNQLVAHTSKSIGADVCGAFLRSIGRRTQNGYQVITYKILLQTADGRKFEKITKEHSNSTAGDFKTVEAACLSVLRENGLPFGQVSVDFVGTPATYCYDFKANQPEPEPEPEPEKPEPAASLKVWRAYAAALHPGLPTSLAASYAIQWKKEAKAAVKAVQRCTPLLTFEGAADVQLAEVANTPLAKAAGLLSETSENVARIIAKGKADAENAALKGWTHSPTTNGPILRKGAQVARYGSAEYKAITAPVPANGQSYLGQLMLDEAKAEREGEKDSTEMVKYAACQFRGGNREAAAKCLLDAIALPGAVDVAGLVEELENEDDTLWGFRQFTYRTFARQVGVPTPEPAPFAGAPAGTHGLLYFWCPLGKAVYSTNQEKVSSLLILRGASALSGEQALALILAGNEHRSYEAPATAEPIQVEEREGYRYFDSKLEVTLTWQAFTATGKVITHSAQWLRADKGTYWKAASAYTNDDGTPATIEVGSLSDVVSAYDGAGNRVPCVKVAPGAAKDRRAEGQVEHYRLGWDVWSTNLASIKAALVAVKAENISDEELAILVLARSPRVVANRIA